MKVTQIDEKNKELKKRQATEEIWRIVTAILFLLAMVIGVASDKGKR